MGQPRDPVHHRACAWECRFSGFLTQLARACSTSERPWHLPPGQGCFEEPAMGHLDLEPSHPEWGELLAGNSRACRGIQWLRWFQSQATCVTLSHHLSSGGDVITHLYHGKE